MCVAPRYRARIISWPLSVNIFWNAMHLAQKVDHYSWIQGVQHLAHEPKEVYIRAIIGDISGDCNAIWRKNLDTKPPTYSVRPIIVCIYLYFLLEV